MDVINKETFDTNVISEGQLTFVDFFTTWCRPCNLLAPVLEELSEDHEDINFVKVDIEAEPELSSDYGITSIPTLVIFNDGKEIDRKTGLLSKTALKDWLSEIEK